MKQLTLPRIKPVLGKSAWVAITNYVSVGLFLLASIVAARLLGPSGRGELAAVQNWALLAVTVGSLGIPYATVYYAGNRSRETSEIFATAQIVLAFLSVPVIATVFYLMPWLMPGQESRVIEDARIFLLLVPIQFVLNLPYFVILGLNKIHLWNIIRLQFPIMWLGVFVVGYFQHSLSSSFAARGYLIVSLIHGITWMIAILVILRGVYRPKLKWVSPLFRYGLPSVLGSTPRQLNLRGDQLLMAALLPTEILGLYVVAVAWSGLIQPMTSAFAQTIFPNLAGSHDVVEQRRMLQHTLHMTIFVSLFMGAMMLVVTPLIIPLIYGQEFVAAVPVAFVLVFAGLVSGINNVLGDAFRGLGFPKRPMIAELVGLIATVGLLLLLLPRFQMMGAAVASLVSYLTVLAMLTFFLKRWSGETLSAYFIPTANDMRTIAGRIGQFLPKI